MVPMLGSSDKICVGGVALRLRLLLGLLLRATLGRPGGEVTSSCWRPWGCLSFWKMASTAS
jgi:hypothetical protein